MAKVGLSAKPTSKAGMNSGAKGVGTKAVGQKNGK
jgi:hypothetical protein